jgi:hypothetical protein
MEGEINDSSVTRRATLTTLRSTKSLCSPQGACL